MKTALDTPEQPDPAKIYRDSYRRIMSVLATALTRSGSMRHRRNR